MFTGLVEEVGTVASIKKGINSSKITINAKKVLEDVILGDSIATNGICLTVVEFTQTSFTVDVMKESLRVTNLGNLKTGDKLNLERALRLGDRLGGNIVSGHIDGTGKIESFLKEDNAVVVTISASYDLLRYIIYKGSIAIDGVSLTVFSIDDTSFKVSIIPHTGVETTLLTKAIKDTVNLECDMVGKYIEKLILNREKTNLRQPNRKDLSMSFLNEFGFL